MTKEEKQNIDSNILLFISKIVEDESETDGVMFLHVDREFENIMVSIQGNVQLLANGFHAHLDNNEEFRRFLTSVVGSWLVKNPEEERMFMEGLNIAKNSMGVN